MCLEIFVQSDCFEWLNAESSWRTFSLPIWSFFTISDFFREIIAETFDHFSKRKAEFSLSPCIHRQHVPYSYIYELPPNFDSMGLALVLASYETNSMRRCMHYDQIACRFRRNWFLWKESKRTKVPSETTALGMGFSNDVLREVLR
jgi:hypothetical protein